MNNYFSERDYLWIKELMNYPLEITKQLDYFTDTSEINVPDDPIDRVIFQDRAKEAIRKVAQNKGHVLMVGRPGTGKSLLANMFKEVIEKSMGDYLKPKKAIVAYPGKDRNHIRFAYEDPQKIDQYIMNLQEKIEAAGNYSENFNLEPQIKSVKKMQISLFAGCILSALAGIFFYPQAFIATGLLGMGAIFMFIQQNNLKSQEKIHQNNQNRESNVLKNLYNQIPEVLYDPRKDGDIMARVSEPDSRNMKGGFRHDPYQSGNLQTPAHKRAYLGAHAKSPIIYVDELKAMIRVGYMPHLLEIMQNKEYVLEGGSQSGSGAADRSENKLCADNIIIACCNHDTLRYLQEEGNGAFLSRIEDKGEIILMDSAVPESKETILQVVQYIKQEIINLQEEIDNTWGEIIKKEGHFGVKKRCEQIFGKPLAENYVMKVREFSRAAVLEIVKELRCRAGNRKLSSILRPVNGIIKMAEYEAIFDNSELVEANHIKSALEKHLSLEGVMTKELLENRKDLKRYISSLTDSIGYVVGLAVIEATAGGQMYGQPLPIHCQITAGGADTVIASGKIGDIAKSAAQNVRASIKKIFNKIGIPYVGYEMHIEYIQAHGGVEGDSASAAMDVALMSDYIERPVNQKYGLTGSLTGDIVLAVGGVTEKVRSIMDPSLGMEGACIPWQNKHDIEPLLLNTNYCYIEKDSVPGIRIFRNENDQSPFDIYFCKTKYHVYRILMDIDEKDMEKAIIERTKKDLKVFKTIASGKKRKSLEN
jgi:Lon-like ATP-dependent protease